MPDSSCNSVSQNIHIIVVVVCQDYLIEVFNSEI